MARTDWKYCSRFGLCRRSDHDELFLGDVNDFPAHSDVLSEDNDFESLLNLYRLPDAGLASQKRMPHS